MKFNSSLIKPPADVTDFEGTLPENLPLKGIDLEFIMEATDLSKERLLELNP